MRYATANYSSARSPRGLRRDAGSIAIPVSTSNAIHKRRRIGQQSPARHACCLGRGVLRMSTRGRVAFVGDGHVAICCAASKSSDASACSASTIPDVRVQANPGVGITTMATAVISEMAQATRIIMGLTFMGSGLVQVNCLLDSARGLRNCLLRRERPRHS